MAFNSDVLSSTAKVKSFGSFLFTATKKTFEELLEEELRKEEQRVRVTLHPHQIFSSSLF